MNRILCQLKSENGENLGAPLDLPLNIDKSGLAKICQSVTEEEEEVPYLFFVDDLEITSTLAEILEKQGEENLEKVTEIICQPQAVYKVSILNFISTL